jgi:hypothetical protein
MIALHQTLHTCAARLPEAIRTEYVRLFDLEHLAKLSASLLALYQHGLSSERPLPHFAAECTPPLAKAWGFFEMAMVHWDAATDRLAETIVQRFADALVTAGIGNILLLLGQRLTSASITDARAIPPTRSELLASANAEHHPGEHLTVAARALTKHVHRSPEAFWGGEVRGSVPEKNALAAQMLNRILDHATWWNVFGHFAHDLVYEARVPSGHGARWGFAGREFIGFLEPFDEEKCPSLEPSTH